MAILGAQLVFSLVIFSFLQKLACFYSFGRWLLKGRLVRYLHPSDDDLKAAAGIQTNGTGGKGKTRRQDARKPANPREREEFTIPCNTPISLDSHPVETIDLMALNYYSEYIWLVDFSVCAVFVYILTEIYYMFGAWNEFNISILWCLLAIGFVVRMLLNQTTVYFKAEDGGERILIFTFGFFFLVLSMGILVIDERNLEFGLEAGYLNFTAGAKGLLERHGVESAGPVQFFTFKIILAVFCAVTGSLLTFPGLRMAKLHLDALKYSRESPFKQVLLHTNFVLPYVILLLWVKPLSRDILCGLSWSVTTRMFTEPVFDAVRILMFVFLVIIRLFLLPTHMQSHLNIAYEKVAALRKESGRIKNIEIQKMVARVFYVLGMVVIQYLSPLIILLFMAFMYKTLGDYSWSAAFGEPAENYIKAFTQPITAVNISVVGNDTSSVMDKATEFSLAFSDLRSVFTPMFYRGLMSFLTWWVTAAWTVTMSFGLYYHSAAA